MIETFSDIGFDKGKFRGMDYVERAAFTSVERAVEMVARFKEAHKDGLEIVAKYSPPGKTVLILAAINEDSEQNHQLTMIANNRRS